MSEMVERVRTAFLKGFVEACPDGTIDMRLCIDDTPYRAMIAAMREPTTEMLHAATMQIPTWDDEASRRKWQAMIDAALK